MILQVAMLQRHGQLHPDRVGVFGITGDPVHWGHLATMLDAVRTLHLGKVYLVGAAGRSKSSLQISVEQRFNMFRRAAELFQPLIEFVPVEGDPPAESVALDLWVRSTNAGAARPLPSTSWNR